MKRKVVLLGLIILAIIGGAIIYFLPSKSTSEKRIFTSKEIAGLKGISINGNFALSITASDSEDIECSFTKIKKGFVIGDSALIESKIENNILYVNDGDKKNMVCIGGAITERVNIYIPKSYQNKLSVKSKLSKISILNSNSRDINCDVKDSDIAISLDKICGRVSVSTNLGDIDLKLPKDQKFNLSAKSNLGDIKNKLTSNVDSSITDKYINLATDDGDIKISGN